LGEGEGMKEGEGGGGRGVYALGDDGDNRRRKGCGFESKQLGRKEVGMEALVGGEGGGLRRTR
jgi:hypothetical protein